MPADPQYDVVHAKAIPVSNFYGCHSKPRPEVGHPVPSKDGTYPYRFSTECRYDMSTTDTRCEGCPHIKDFKPNF